jgi:hypothetical protein
MADLAENARRAAQGKTPGVISPLALEAVRRIDALFEIERSINGQSAERRQAVRQELHNCNARRVLCNRRRYLPDGVTTLNEASCRCLDRRCDGTVHHLGCC